MSQGLKLSNSESMFKKDPDVPSFEEQADKTVAAMEARKKKSINLCLQFIKILNDKTVPEARSPLVADVEKELVSKLISLATEINNDENEHEGMGAISLITLLIRSILIQRDKINQLSYELDKFRSEIKLSKINPE